MKRTSKALSLFLSVIFVFTTLFTSVSFSFAQDRGYVKGVDISEHNGNVDFKRLKEQGYEFVMIRIGFINGGKDRYDYFFHDNVKAAYDADMNFGLYFYSYAFDEAETTQEADFTIRAIESLPAEYLDKMTLPVAYDVEDKLISNNCTKAQITANTLKYCELLSQAGYTPMVYSNLNWFNNYIDVNQVHSKGIKIWYANWVSNPDFSTIKTVGENGPASYMWQYAAGEIEDDGFDKNVLYTDSNIGFSSVSLSATSYTYNGTARKPAVTVKLMGKTLKNGTDYTVSYSNHVNVGTAAVTIKGIGEYTGQIRKSYKINPKSLSSAAKATLSSSSYTYDGKVKTPGVTVKDEKGNVLKKNTHYTLSYSSGRKNVGQYSVKVTFKGNYSGSKTLNFTIKPKNTSISSVSSLYKGVKVNIKKYTTQTTGYQIQYSTSSKFTGAKTVNLKNTVTSKAITGLTANKKYYVRTRTYKTVSGKNYYSSWSSAKSAKTSSYPTTISLSATSYTYNGKVRKPSVTVKNNGKKISSKYYKVTYSKGRKNPGTYTVTVKFKKPYSGTVKKTFTIKPKSTSISKLTAGKKKFTVKWKKYTTQTTGYQIQYSTDKNFKKNNKTVTVSKNKTTSKSISKLQAKKKYYVRIRTYKTVSGKKIYSSWSKAKAVTTKK